MTHPAHATPNSALYWFPRIEAAGLPVPWTEFMAYDHIKALGLFEDGADDPRDAGVAPGGAS